MLQVVGYASAEGTTITMPTGMQPGDIAYMGAFRDGSATNPSLATGWNNITGTFDGTTCSMRMAWIICSGSGQTSGTWTNATALQVIVFRGCNSTSPFGTSTNTAGTAASLTYGARAILSTTSLVMAMVFHRSINTTTLTNNPSGLVLVSSNLGASCDCAMFLSSGFYTSGDYPSNTVATGGTASGWQTVVVEVKSAPIDNPNLQFVKVGNGLSTSEKWR